VPTKLRVGAPPAMLCPPAKCGGPRLISVMNNLRVWCEEYQGELGEWDDPDLEPVAGDVRRITGRGGNAGIAGGRGVPVFGIAPKAMPPASARHAWVLRRRRPTI
jgi:hypothetical protein